MGLVQRVVAKPYNVPEATRQKMAEALRDRNARRKADGRYTMTDATRAKISIGVTKAIANGRFPKVSKLEATVASILEKLGIRTIPQHAFQDETGRFGALVDFYLPDRNIALEVNGTFWHADPRAYPNGPVKDSQRRTVTQYARKVALLSRLAIPLVEVWEMDLKVDPELAVRSALGL